MSRIETEYGRLIRKAASSARGEHAREDMYHDILLAVTERVLKGRVDPGDAKAMKNTIWQRAIDIRRADTRYRRTFIQSDRPPDISSEPPAMPESIRVAELKKRIRKAMPRLDAAIVIEVAFPSSRARTVARRQPKHGGPRASKLNTRLRPTVRKWHVAELFDISRWRVSQAMRRAREMIEEIVEDER